MTTSEGNRVAVVQAAPVVFDCAATLARVRTDELQRPFIESFGEAALRGRLADVADSSAIVDLKDLAIGCQSNVARNTTILIGPVMVL